MATERHVFKSDMELNGVLTVMKKNALLSNVRYNKPSLSLHDIRHQTSDIRHQTSDIRHQTAAAAAVAWHEVPFSRFGFVY